MKKNINICRIANASLALLMSASHGTSAMESGEPLDRALPKASSTLENKEASYEGSKNLTAQIRAEVERILENFRRNMDAYYQRTGSEKRITFKEAEPAATNPGQGIPPLPALKEKGHKEEMPDYAPLIAMTDFIPDNTWKDIRAANEHTELFKEFMTKQVYSNKPLTKDVEDLFAGRLAERWKALQHPEKIEPTTLSNEEPALDLPEEKEPEKGLPQEGPQKLGEEKFGEIYSSLIPVLKEKGLQAKVNSTNALQKIFDQWPDAAKPLCEAYFGKRETAGTLPEPIPQTKNVKEAFLDALHQSKNSESIAEQLEQGIQKTIGRLYRSFGGASEEARKRDIYARQAIHYFGLLAKEGDEKSQIEFLDTIIKFYDPKIVGSYTSLTQGRSEKYVERAIDILLSSAKEGKEASQDKLIDTIVKLYGSLDRKQREKYFGEAMNVLLSSAKGGNEASQDKFIETIANLYTSLNHMQRKKHIKEAMDMLLPSAKEGVENSRDKLLKMVITFIKLDRESKLNEEYIFNKNLPINNERDFNFILNLIYEEEDKYKSFLLYDLCHPLLINFVKEYFKEPKQRTDITSQINRMKSKPPYLSEQDWLAQKAEDKKLVASLAIGIDPRKQKTEEEAKRLEEQRKAEEEARQEQEAKKLAEQHKAEEAAKQEQERQKEYGKFFPSLLKALKKEGPESLHEIFDRSPDAASYLFEVLFDGRDAIKIHESLIYQAHTRVLDNTRKEENDSIDLFLDELHLSQSVAEKLKDTIQKDIGEAYLAALDLLKLPQEEEKRKIYLKEAMRYFSLAAKQDNELSLTRLLDTIRRFKAQETFVELFNGNDIQDIKLLFDLCVEEGVKLRTSSIQDEFSKNQINNYLKKAREIAKAKEGDEKIQLLASIDKFSSSFGF